MKNGLGDIANDLSKLLSEVKVKPVVVSESKKPKMEQIASELTNIVFKAAPVGTKPEMIAEALVFAAEAKAKQYKLDPKEVFESTIDYCLKVIENAQSKIEN